MSTERCEHGVCVYDSHVEEQTRCFRCDPLEQDELEDLIDEKVAAAIEKFKDQLAVGWRYIAMEQSPPLANVLLEMIEKMDAAVEE